MIEYKTHKHRERKTMKNTSIYPALLILTLFAQSSANANTSPTAYANQITTNNIYALQHSLINSTFNSFHNKNTHSTTIKNTSNMYGHAPMYGTMPQYGEYNDDGRSGGDKVTPTLNNIFATWQHFNNKVKFNTPAPIKTKSDIITLGLGGNEYNITSTIKNTWGIYTGYIGSTQENKNINIDEQGGYFGLYNNFNINKINIKTTLNTGAMDNAIKTSTDTDDFTNFWIGGAARLSYDLKLDKTLTFTPEIFAGYTWIKSNNYTSTTGEYIKNNSANYFEFTPAINLIKNIGNNWFGILSAKYIIHNNSNQTTVNNIKLNNLDTGNYFEYTLTINKQFSNLDLGINIGRHDGDRYGWLGGAKIKYLF